MGAIPCAVNPNRRGGLYQSCSTDALGLVFSQCTLASFSVSRYNDVTLGSSLSTLSIAEQTLIHPFETSCGDGCRQNGLTHHVRTSQLAIPASDKSTRIMAATSKLGNRISTAPAHALPGPGFVISKPSARS